MSNRGWGPLGGAELFCGGDRFAEGAVPVLEESFGELACVGVFGEECVPDVWWGPRAETLAEAVGVEELVWGEAAGVAEPSVGEVGVGEGGACEVAVVEVGAYSACKS